MGGLFVFGESLMELTTSRQQPSELERAVSIFWENLLLDKKDGNPGNLDIAFDRVIKTVKPDRMPFEIGDNQIAISGECVNMAVPAASFVENRINVYLVTAFGDCTSSRYARAFLCDSGVQVGLIQQIKGEHLGC